MPESLGRVTLSAAVPIEMKERIQRIASEKRWTMSQTVVIFFEEFLDVWESELGLSTNTATEQKPRTLSKNTSSNSKARTRKAWDALATVCNGWFP